MRALITALALLAASPSVAQPALSDPTAIPADALVPDEDARALFEVLSSNAMTDEMLATMIRAMPGEGFRPVDQVIEQTLVPGELVAGWQASGIDLLPVIAALEGGLAGNIVEGSGQFGTDRVYLVDGPFDTFVQPEWVLVGQRGSPFSGDNVHVQVGYMSPKLILVERVAYRRQGNAYCRERAESRLYADPAVVASEFDMIAVMITMRSLAKLEQRGMCEVVEETTPGQYRTRLFDVEGRRLLGMEAQNSFRIVPRPAPSPSQ